MTRFAWLIAVLLAFSTTALAAPQYAAPGYVISCEDELLVLAVPGHGALVPESLPGGGTLYKLCSDGGASAATCDTVLPDLVEGEGSLALHIDAFDHLPVGSIRSVMLLAVGPEDEPEPTPAPFPWQREGTKLFIYVPVPTEPTVPPIGERGVLDPMSPAVSVPWEPIGDWPPYEW